MTVTFGFGETIFALQSEDRFGIASHCPPSLKRLPHFANDALDPTASDGDIGIQICGDSHRSTVAAVRRLTRAADGVAVWRWIRHGFRSGDPARGRNLLGFRDGTHNLSPDDARSLRRFVWVGAEGPLWLCGGTFLVARRIARNLRAWEALPLREQELTIGRHKRSGAPLGAKGEFDPVVLTDLPRTSHVRIAASDDSVRILRRSYNYGARSGRAAATHSGLEFISFQRSVETQFIPLQRRLAATDALNAFTRHTASAVFAIPPGVRHRHEFVGQSLLDG